MRKLLLSLLLGIFQAVSAGTFEDGYAAYQRGDYEAAFQIWRPLALQGMPAAQYNLGLMYAEGLGVAEHGGTAVAWLRKAAELGYAEAQYYIALIYENGRGVSRDYVVAYAYYSLAAEQGYKAARSSLERVNKNMTDHQIAHAKRLMKYYRPKTRKTTLPSTVTVVPWLPRVDPSLVRNVQEHLTKLGYKPGPHDGIVGDQTLAAIKAYQQDHGIKPDGVISQHLLALLQRSLGAASSESETTED